MTSKVAIQREDEESKREDKQDIKRQGEIKKSSSLAVSTEAMCESSMFEKQILLQALLPPIIHSSLPHNGISDACSGKLDSYNSIDNVARLRTRIGRAYVDAKKMMRTHAVALA